MVKNQSRLMQLKIEQIKKAFSCYFNHINTNDVFLLKHQNLGDVPIRIVEIIEPYKSILPYVYIIEIFDSYDHLERMLQYLTLFHILMRIPKNYNINSKLLIPPIIMFPEENEFLDWYKEKEFNQIV